MTLPALRMIKDAAGRIEYRTLGGKFVCMDLRTQDQRQAEFDDWATIGRGDAHMQQEMMWLQDCMARVDVDNFVIPHKTTGGKG